MYNIQYYCLSSNKNALIVPWIVLVAGHLADLIIEFNKDHLIKILSRCIGKEIIPRRRPTTCLPTSRPPARRMLTSSHTLVLLEVSIMYMSVAVIYNICILYSKLNIWCICHIQVRHIVLNIEYILAKGEHYCTVFTVVIKQNIWGKM